MQDLEENKIIQNKIRIGVLRGGSGEHFDISLKQGSDALLYISNNFSDKFTPIDIFVDKEGMWHERGLPIFFSDLPHKVDVVWNTAHNSLGQMLKGLNIPAFNAGHNSSFLTNNNHLLQSHIKNMGGSMPKSILLPAYQADFDGDKELYSEKKAKEVFQKFGAPWVVKTYTKDSGVGIHVAKTYPELISSLNDILEHSNNSILVEELVLGKAVSVHSVKGFRNEDFYNFPLLDVKTDHLFAINHFSDQEKDSIFAFTKDLHKSLDGNNHYIKVDYVIKPNGKVYVTNTHFAPDLRDNSHLAKSSLSVGSKIHDIFEHIINNTLKHS